MSYPGWFANAVNPDRMALLVLADLEEESGNAGLAGAYRDIHVMLYGPIPETEGRWGWVRARKLDCVRPYVLPQYVWDALPVGLGVERWGQTRTRCYRSAADAYYALAVALLGHEAK